MKKFILIDQSIKHSGGHHLEYALSVLSAAKRSGYTTLLATNSVCSDIRHEDIDIVDKAFKYTFWENFKTRLPSSSNSLYKFKKKFIISFVSFINFILDSTLCYSILAAPHFNSLKSMIDSHNSSFAVRKSNFFFLALGYCIHRGYKLLVRFVDQVFHLKKIFHALNVPLKIVLVLLAIPLAPFILLAYLIQLKFRPNKINENSEQFKNDLKSLLTRIQVSEYDIVFIPTLCEIELLGTANLFLENSGLQCSWHFLFRRNLYEFREPSYQREIENIKDTILAFSKFKTMSTSKKVFFYTDTDCLTHQYNSLGVFKFHTLPIPVETCYFTFAENSKKPLNISYIGDARDEKGFGVLPRLVQDLEAAGYDKNQITFTFQSNFNDGLGEPDSKIAKSELSSDTNDWINLKEGPFDSKEYYHLINESDLILIPYSSKNYYARSSGIFTEALAKGVPVVISDKTWMSQEAQLKIQNYFQGILSQSTKLQTIRSSEGKRLNSLFIEPKGRGSSIWLMLEIDQSFSRPGFYLETTWQSEPLSVLRKSKTDNFQKLFISDLRTTKVFSLMKLPRNKKIKLSFKVDKGDGTSESMLDLPNLGLQIKLHELNTNTLTSSYSLMTYSDEADISTSVIEMIENYPMYKTQMDELSKTWVKKHNSNNLIKTLEEITYG